jgi:hypothetical protein
MSADGGHLAISGHSIYIGPYGKYVLKSSPLKPVSQFKVNMAWMVLKRSIFRINKIHIDNIVKFVYKGY